MAAPECLVEGYSTVSLAELDRRASLQRRVDHKYVVNLDQLRELSACLRDDHDALEIDAERAFRYESVYFDTEDLRCYCDHVVARRPRFKVRTRFYANSGDCVVEVKLKLADKTDKRSMKYPPGERARLSGEAARFVQRTLTHAEADQPESQLAPSLRTSFERVTFSDEAGTSRVTCDFGVRLDDLRRGAVRLREHLALVETKTEDGELSADRVLADLGVEPRSLSKYRVGVALVRRRDPDEQALAVAPLFA